MNCEFEFCLSLKTQRIEHLFTYSYSITSFSMKLLFLFSCVQTYFANFPIFHLFFPNWFIRMLCKSCIVFLCRLIWYESIFCQLNLDSYSLYGIIDKQMFLILMQLNISIFYQFFYACLINPSIPPYHNFLS